MLALTIGLQFNSLILGYLNSYMFGLYIKFSPCVGLCLDFYFEFFGINEKKLFM